ncbi:uncharacterized protein LOC134543078 [Bacillus rossius redtenbacheri]|uniref:uncharacterized protein LOC134543078 n=1 Tax=Bacillus rossius redtenbacheri TaxID=93214 RepID=UPI002FDC7FAF
MYAEGLNVTVDTILKEIRERQIDYYGGRSSLHKLLKKMGFSWTTVDGRKALIENENIVLKRIDFLRKYTEEKERGANFIFVDETWIFQRGKALIYLKICSVVQYKVFHFHFIYFSGTVSKSWQDKSLQSAKRRTVGDGKRFIVVNAGGRTGFVPGAGLLFVSGQKTADYHGEMNGETFLMWFEDMLVHLEEPSVIIMDNASYHSTQVEKTPTTNWTKDALIAWLEKNEIKHENNLLKVELLRIAKQNKPRIRWARCVDHVEKLIQADWEREVHIDSGTIPPLIIHLGEDSSSEDSDSEEFEVTTQQVDGDSEVLAVPLDDLPGCSY